MDGDDGAAAKIARAVAVLEENFGIPSWRRKEPLDELMVTMLSQNTNDANRDLAYRRLREWIPTWDRVMTAPAREVEAAIRPAGLSRQKSERMQGVLRWLALTFGTLTLEPLRAMTDDQVMDLLTTQNGIGVKTAAVLLTFAFDRDLCPVDTHVHRIAGRLGWVSPGTPADKTFHILRPLIPAGKAPTFHLNLLKFGRTICTARAPRCGGCPLWEDCGYPGKGKEST